MLALTALPSSEKPIADFFLTHTVDKHTVLPRKFESAIENFHSLFGPSSLTNTAFPEGLTATECNLVKFYKQNTTHTT